MEQGRSQPVLNGESRIKLLAHIDTILKMAEHFKESGERERWSKNAATRRTGCLTSSEMSKETQCL